MRTLTNLAAALFTLGLMTGCPDNDDQSLLSSNNGGSGGTGSNPAGLLTFTNGQAAFLVLGQPDFTSGGPGVTSSRFDQLGQATIGTSGKLWIVDGNNTRVVGYNSFPIVNGAAADLVIGQVDFTSNTPASSSTELANPYSAVDNGTQLFVSDKTNHRIQVFNTIPSSSTPSADFSLGAANPSSVGVSTCSQSEFMSPQGLFATLNYLYVADPDCNRVTIFSLPITANKPNAIRVIGQPDFTTSTAGTSQSALNTPYTVWSNDTRIIIGDAGNNRALLYNSFPTTDGANADLVLGQADFTSAVSGVTTQSSLYTDSDGYIGVASNGTQVFVADIDNSRVMIWNSWPTSNGQNADVVLGQPDFTSHTVATTQTGLSFPANVFVTSQYLIVTEPYVPRVLIWKSP